MAEPVSETVAKEMSLDLFNYLKKVGKYSLLLARQNACGQLFFLEV